MEERKELYKMFYLEITNEEISQNADIYLTKTFGNLSQKEISQLISSIVNLSYALKNRTLQSCVLVEDEIVSKYLLRVLQLESAPDYKKHLYKLRLKSDETYTVHDAIKEYYEYVIQ